MEAAARRHLPEAAGQERRSHAAFPMRKDFLCFLLPKPCNPLSSLPAPPPLQAHSHGTGKVFPIRLPPRCCSRIQSHRHHSSLKLCWNGKLRPVKGPNTSRVRAGWEWHRHRLTPWTPPCQREATPQSTGTGCPKLPWRSPQGVLQSRA